MSGETTLRFDPHVHTAASHDARGSVADVLRQADERGLAAIGITDHDTVDGAQRALDIQHRYDVLVVPGVEISTADGHLLGLGISEHPPVGQSLVATVEWVRDRGGIAVVPHPFQRSRHGVGKSLLADCDGVEVFNAWAVTGIQNRRAAAFANRVGQPGLGASDAHRPETVGTAATELRIDGPLTVQRVLDAVVAGRCRAVGRSIRLSTSLRTYATALTQFIRHRPRANSTTR
jgi:Predicted metal-dependent phosphoesterases (PHP family)